MSALSQVRLVEVGPRDGLQNEKRIISVADKIRLINLLSETGLMSIEVGAFVSARKVPQMADSDQVYTAILKKPDVSYSILVPNIQGFEQALRLGVKEIAVFAAASEAFSQKNIDCSINESFQRFAPILEAAARHAMKVRGYVSCVFGCPYEGEVKFSQVASVVERLLDMGCYEVSLGDTIGVGTPKSTQNLLKNLSAAQVPLGRLAGHFHDTHHQACENIRIALQEGIFVFDSAIGGLGGCPYAPSAGGNVSTSKVIETLEKEGVHLGINKQKIKACEAFLYQMGIYRV